MKFYSNGKLLLTGEYLVMKGALALALPVKFGQSLQVMKLSSQDILEWDATGLEGTWFDAKFSLSDLSIISTSSDQKAKFLQDILQKACSLNPKALNSNKSLKVTTNVNFDINWGLGTSSTLINNIALWFEVNAFVLHALVSNGSGYDIACASHETPILYQKTQSTEAPNVKQVDLPEAFYGNTFFVYSGNKIHTEGHINKIRQRSNLIIDEVDELTNLTNEIVKVSSIEQLIEHLANHEGLVGKYLGVNPIQTERFTDFKGIVKSLGAWGGDFMMVVTGLGQNYVRKYFEQFNLSKIISIEKMLIR